MTDKNSDKNLPGASGVRKRSQVPTVIRPLRRVVHGLFFDPRRHYLDQRTRIARIIKSVTGHLLEPFGDSPPAGAVLIARQAAYKALRLRAFEHSVLMSEDGKVAATTDEAYWSMSNSLTRDVELLHKLARESGPPSKVPTLAEYLEGIKTGKIVVADGGDK